MDLLVCFGETVLRFCGIRGGNSECAGKVAMIEWDLISGTIVKDAASSAARMLEVIAVEKGKAKNFRGS